MTVRAQRVREARGYLVPIGGAEQKIATREPLILGRFVYVAGGRRAKLVVIPAASSLPDTGARYCRVFRHLGARSVDQLHPRTRKEANDPEAVALIRGSTGVFLTGGNQFRLSKRLVGTALAQAIREVHAGGASVGGTSAGAAFLSANMIAFGKSGSTPRPDMVTLAPGLGLTSRFIIDQHFRQRDRLGRLLTALAGSPRTIGLGLDEDTAAFIEGDRFEVVGNGAITVVDARRVETWVPPAHADRHDPICMTNLKLHVLVHGAAYDIGRRQATVPCPAPKEALK
jgi:cyanophycinase